MLCLLYNIQNAQCKMFFFCLLLLYLNKYQPLQFHYNDDLMIFVGLGPSPKHRRHNLSNWKPLIIESAMQIVDIVSSTQHKNNASVGWNVQCVNTCVGIWFEKLSILVVFFFVSTDSTVEPNNHHVTHIL